MRLKIVLGIIIIAIIAVLIYTNLWSVMNDNRPKGNPSLDELNLALNYPEVIELLGKRNLTSIEFSKFTDPHTKKNYIQIVFHPEDPDPDDCLTPSMIIVQINDSGVVDSVYETYPNYLPSLPDCEV